MNGTNELQKLKALRDAEKKQLSAYVEQKERALKEHSVRMAQMNELIENSERAVVTWNKLLTLLEENTQALKEIENAS